MDKILVLDFGGQYNQLIARRIREQNVFAEVIPSKSITPEEIKVMLLEELSPKKSLVIEEEEGESNENNN